MVIDIPVAEPYKTYQISTIPVYTDFSPEEENMEEEQAQAVTASPNQERDLASQLVDILKSRKTRDTDQMYSIKSIITPKWVIGSADVNDSDHFKAVFAFKESDCREKNSIIICMIDRSNLLLRKCALSLLNLARSKSEFHKQVIQHCTTSSIMTSTPCLVRSTPGGYLVSTSSEIDIIADEAETSKSHFFANQKSSTCKNVCLVSNSPSKRFTCNGQVYKTHVVERRQITSEISAVKVDFSLDQLKPKEYSPIQLSLDRLVGSENVGKYNVAKEVLTVVSLIWWSTLITYLLVRCVINSKVAQRYFQRKKKKGFLPNPLSKKA